MDTQLLNRLIEARRHPYASAATAELWFATSALARGERTDAEVALHTAEEILGIRQQEGV